MSTRQVSDRNDPVIESSAQLIAPMIKGEKPRERWRIGTEHEKLVFARSDHHAPPVGQCETSHKPEHDTLQAVWVNNEFDD